MQQQIELQPLVVVSSSDIKTVLGCAACEAVLLCPILEFAPLLATHCICPTTKHAIFAPAGNDQGEPNSV